MDFTKRKTQKSREGQSVYDINKNIAQDYNEYTCRELEKHITDKEDALLELKIQHKNEQQYYQDEIDKLKAILAEMKQEEGLV